MHKRSPRPGGRPERLGYTQVFRVPPPPFQGHLPLPRGSQRAPQHSHSPAGDGRLCTHPAPTTPGGPPKMGLGPGRGPGPGGGRGGLTGAAAAAAAAARTPARPPPAAVPARLRPPLPAQVRRSSPAPPFFPPNLRRLPGRKEGECPGPERRGPGALP